MLDKTLREAQREFAELEKAEGPFDVALHIQAGLTSPRFVAALIREYLSLPENTSSLSRSEIELVMELVDILGPLGCQRLYHTAVAATRFVGSKPRT